MIKIGKAIKIFSFYAKATRTISDSIFLVCYTKKVVYMSSKRIKSDAKH